MGNVAYMSLFDTAGELIQGGSYVEDRKGCIEVHKINYNVSRTVDSQTGKTHSTRRHQPFNIVKKIDCSSPALFHACTSGKLLNSACIDLYRTGDEGQEEIYYKFILTGVRIISVTPLIDSDSSQQDMEAISMSFESIEVTYQDGNLTANDSWNSR